MVAASPPAQPACRKPRNVARLTPIGPGVICDTAIKLPSSSSVSHCRAVTSSSM
ncbi:MAG: hypothetical protein L6W00_27670 [Lentisphaeria bacterium]|nr:MAG: hypothetical protein L6W00_27670 [Lentisphaeria bacterium]